MHPTCLVRRMMAWCSYALRRPPSSQVCWTRNDDVQPALAFQGRVRRWACRLWEPVDAHAAGDQTKQVPRRPHPWKNSRRPPAVRACNTSPRVPRHFRFAIPTHHMLCDRFCMGCHGQNGMGAHTASRHLADPALRMCWIYDAKNSRDGGAANNGGHQPALPRILRRSKLASHSNSLRAAKQAQHCCCCCCSRFLESGREGAPAGRVGRTRFGSFQDKRIEVVFRPSNSPGG